MIEVRQQYGAVEVREGDLRLHVADMIEVRLLSVRAKPSHQLCHAGRPVELGHCATTKTALAI